MQQLDDLESAVGGTDPDPLSVRDFLAAHLSGIGPEVTLDLIAGGRSNPTYAVSDGRGEWILRRPPLGLVLETAHDMHREYRVLTALTGTPVPVPRPVAFCADESVIGAPFYLMERIPGRTVRTRDDAAALGEQQRRALGRAAVDTLAALHRIDPAAVGLADFGHPDGYLQRQLRRWQRQWTAAHTRDRAQVDRLFQILGASVPVTRSTGIVHGDYKLDNLMVRPDEPGQVVGLLDWEMSTLGDPLADLGLLLSFWDQPGEAWNPLTDGVTALPGFPAPAELVERYAARRGDAGLDRLDWYTSLADLKIAVIFEQIHVRHQAGQTVGTGFEGIGDMVGPLVDRALTRMAGPPSGGRVGRTRSR